LSWRGFARLAYIAAVAPDARETAHSQLDQFETEIFSHIEVANGRVWMFPEGVGYLSEEEQRIV
jgi:hypothetical protein